MSRTCFILIALLIPLALLAQLQVEWVWTDSGGVASSSDDLDFARGGGVIVTGSTAFAGTVARLNENGEQAWINEYETHIFRQVVHLDNGGFCFQSHNWLFTTDSLGAIVDSFSVMPQHLDIAGYTCMERVGNRILAIYEYEYNDTDGDYHWGWDYGTNLSLNGEFVSYRIGGEAVTAREEYSIHSICALDAGGILMGLELSFWPRDIILRKREGSDNWFTSIDPFGDCAYSWGTMHAVGDDGIYCVTKREGYCDTPSVQVYKLSLDGDSLWYRDITGTEDAGQRVAGLYAISPNRILVLLGTDSGVFETARVTMLDSTGAIHWSQDIEQDEAFMPTGSLFDENGCLTIAGNVNSVDNVRMRVIRVRIDTEASAEETSPVVDKAMLYTNFPNPFNPTTEITFGLERATRTSLKIYDVLGREVATLADGMLEAGTHRVAFDGSGLASGVYIYRLESNNFAQSKKMVLLK